VWKLNDIRRKLRIELKYIHEPFSTELRRCIEEKKAYGRFYIGNLNKLMDYVAWQCAGYWLTPIWRTWRAELESICGLKFNGFKHLASYTYPGEWIAGRITWHELLMKLVKVVGEKCNVEFYLEK
jgi:hypothetical protein